MFSSYFCRTKNMAVKKKIITFLKMLVGMPLVYSGVVLILLLHFMGLTNNNLLLFLPVFCITIGIIGYVRHIKHDRDY